MTHEEPRGLHRLEDVLAGACVDLTGWTLEEATGISADGLTVVGWGTGSGRGPGAPTAGA